jgi:4-amino-4-deoxy-L-arabinose transferase-like glycosyltransferase
VFGTDTLQVPAWTAIALCVVKAEQDGEQRWWYAAGAIGGVAFLGKYMVALYLASLALGLALSPQRKLLARWQPWAAAVLAAAIAAPNLAWQAQNGWPFVAHTAVVGKAYQALPPQDRRRAAFFAWNFGDAAAIDFFGGLPPAISGHENYFLWGARRTDGSVVFVLGGKREDLLKIFRSVEAVGRFDHPLAMPEERNQTLWLCRDIKEPVERVWPRLRSFG